MARKQIKLTFYVGSEVWPAFETEKSVLKVRNFLAESASHVCGGCTTYLATGHWVKGEDRRLQEFVGRVEQEDVIVLELTCEEHKEVAVFEKMKDRIGMLAKFNPGLQLDWIHVTRQEITGLHFSCAELNGV